MAELKNLEPTWFAYLDHPTVGSGWRVVSVRKYGWKWLFLQACGSKINFKMTLKKWATISRRPMYKDSAGEWKAAWEETIHGDNAIPGVKNGRQTKTKAAKSRRKTTKKFNVQAKSTATKKRKAVV